MPAFSVKPARLPPGGEMPPMSTSGSWRTSGFACFRPRKTRHDAGVFRETSPIATRRQDAANEHQRKLANLRLRPLPPKENPARCQCCSAHKLPSNRMITRRLSVSPHVLMPRLQPYSWESPLLRSPKRKLREAALFQPRRTFPRLAALASRSSVSLSGVSKAAGRKPRTAIPEPAAGGFTAFQ